MLNDPQQLLSVFLRGAMGKGGRKRAKKAAKFMTGNKGFLTASTLLTAAGVAWGIYEAAQGQGGASWAGGAGGAGGAGWAGGAGGGTVPPIPMGVSTGPAGGFANPVELEVLRLVRLAVSAARADGTLSAQERALILEHAREAGVEQVVEAEMLQPRPLGQIVAGVADQQKKQDLYTLAFAIVRADESVSGAERIYLAQLAHQLGLDPATTSRLETEAAAKIDDETDQEVTS